MIDWLNRWDRLSLGFVVSPRPILYDDFFSLSEIQEKKKAVLIMQEF